MTSISSKKPTWNWLAIKWLGIISLFLSSCDAPKEIGADLFSVEVGLNYTDTLTIKSGTVLMDSIQTGGNSTFLLGSYYHPELGYVSSNVFTQLANADTLNSKATSIVDSLQMHLIYKNTQGDLSQPQTIELYRLADTLSTLTSYYTNSSVAIKPELLKRFSFVPKPIKKESANGDSVQFDTLKFQIPLALGKELISKYTDKAISGGGSAFRNYFRGLYIKSEAGKKASLLAFSPTYSRMTLHWHNPGDTTKYYLNYYFSLSNAYVTEINARFNQISAQRIGPLAAIVKPGDKVSSLKTNNTTYVQSGTGIVTKIELPYLLNLRGNRNVAVNKAELVFSGIDKLDFNQTIGQLSLIESDGSNKPLRNSYGLKYIYSEGGAGVATATYDIATNSYTFNVTTLMQSMLSGKKANLGYLLTPAISADAAGNAKILNESGRFIALNALKAKLKIYYSYIAK
ncbi:MAG: hypothetical protein RI903_1090 [Bacteroidota bacterium]